MATELITKFKAMDKTMIESVVPVFRTKELQSAAGAKEVYHRLKFNVTDKKASKLLKQTNKIIPTHRTA